MARIWEVISHPLLVDWLTVWTHTEYREYAVSFTLPAATSKPPSTQVMLFMNSRMLDGIARSEASETQQQHTK